MLLLMSMSSSAVYMFSQIVAVVAYLREIITIRYHLIFIAAEILKQSGVVYLRRS